MFDIIGDIHGHASALERLLIKLGYELRADGWQQAGRKVIFLGDFIDRGPEQAKTIEIARQMVENDHALAVMGNHEFNAIALTTEDASKPGEFLRPHTQKNLRQHQAFLNEIRSGSRSHRKTIDWFKELPLFLDLDEIRVVHACWHEEHLATLAPFLDNNAVAHHASWPELCRDGTDAFAAAEIILKGMEIPLPTGVVFTDKDGHTRKRTRTHWWLTDDALTYRDLAMVPSDIIEQIPHDPVPAHLQPGYDGEKPLFIGHYWMSGRPDLINQHIACVDWSIAASDNPKAKLCAYQWDGETQLSAKNMVWVDR